MQYDENIKKSYITHKSTLENEKSIAIALIYLWNGDMDGFVKHFKSINIRVDGIEVALMNKAVLKNNQGEVEHETMLNMIWDKWGEPNATIYRKLIKAKPYPNFDTSIGRAIIKIEEKWNFNHPKWEEEDSAFYFARLVFSNRHEKIQEHVDNGWKIPFDFLKSIKVNKDKLEGLEFYMIDNITSLEYLYEMLDMYETKEKMIENFKESGAKKIWKI